MGFIPERDRAKIVGRSYGDLTVEIDDRTQQTFTVCRRAYDDGMVELVRDTHWTYSDVAAYAEFCKRQGGTTDA